MRFFTLAWAASWLAILAACGSSFEDQNDGSGGSGAGGPAGPCNEDPWSCPASQTCWIGGDFSYQCLNQGPGGPGAACTPTLGTAQCGAGLFCASVNMATPACVPFCDNTDPARACPAGTLCRVAEVQDVPGLVNICVP